MKKVFKGSTNKVGFGGKKKTSFNKDNKKSFIKSNKDFNKKVSFKKKKQSKKRKDFVYLNSKSINRKFINYIILKNHFKNMVNNYIIRLRIVLHEDGRHVFQVKDILDKNFHEAKMTDKQKEYIRNKVINTVKYNFKNISKDFCSLDTKPLIIVDKGEKFEFGKNIFFEKEVGRQSLKKNKGDFCDAFRDLINKRY